MNADEIRKQHQATKDAIAPILESFAKMNFDRQGKVDAVAATMAVHACNLLAEVAAQLAEIHDDLTRIAGADGPLCEAQAVNGAYCGLSQGHRGPHIVRNQTWRNWQ